MITAIITFISLTIAIVWSVIFLPASLLGYRVHKINGAKMKIFLKKVNHSSIWTNDEPDGWICGKWYIGFIHVVTGQNFEQKDLWLLCSKNFYQIEIEKKDISDNGKINKITYWVREGCFWRLTYINRLLNLPKKPANEKQLNTINKIINTYESINHAVCILYGPAGGGKSMTVQYLCAELLKTKNKVNLCDTHAPYEHGDNFDSFYNKINPTEDSPLVLVFEEVDGMIYNLHNGKIEQKQHNPIQIKNKTDWNCFLDKFDRDIYPYLILIMTTNKDIKWFDDLDPSYLRDGRVNLKIDF